jgi:hypothetical protein
MTGAVYRTMSILNVEYFEGSRRGFGSLVPLLSINKTGCYLALVQVVATYSVDKAPGW